MFLFLYIGSFMYLTVNLIYFCNSLGCSFFFFLSRNDFMLLLNENFGQIPSGISRSNFRFNPPAFPLFFSFPLWKLIGLRPGKQLESRGTRRERFIDAWRAHIISSYFGVSKSPLVFESILIIKRKYCLLKKLHLHFKVKLKKK